MMRRLLPALSSILVGAGCAAPAITTDQVQGVLAAQAEAWNRGDLEAFVESYWDDARLTFCGSEGVVRGRADLLAKYHASYPTAEARGQLRFDLIEVRPVGADAALVLGQYHLARTDPASGYFTLLVQRTAAGLAIAHDHTSASKRAVGK
jgi:uncharacterized protein (TIGR02246 family)